MAVVSGRVGALEDYWLLGAELGKGGCGTVKVARSLTTDGVVCACKIQPLDELSRAEAAIMQRLEHPHIVRMVDYFEDRGKTFIVMERANNGDLFSLLERCKRFSEDEAREFLRNCLLAIKYIHDLDVVHRDIKPDNCLLSENSTNVKLADWGFASSSTGALRATWAQTVTRLPKF